MNPRPKSPRHPLNPEDSDPSVRILGSPRTSARTPASTQSTLIAEPLSAGVMRRGGAQRSCGRGSQKLLVPARAESETAVGALAKLVIGSLAVCEAINFKGLLLTVLAGMALLLVVKFVPERGWAPCMLLLAGLCILLPALEFASRLGLA